VAEIEAFKKIPDKRVHQHYGIWKIANPKDKTSGAFEVLKSREEIKTIHHRRTRGEYQSIREISRKEKRYDCGHIRQGLVRTGHMD
jgi:hypothetical protein